MSKYKSEFKLEVVKYVLEQYRSASEAAEKFNLPKSPVESWVRKYNKHGILGLIKNNIKYDGKFKIDVIKYMHTNHLSLTETAIHFNLGHHSIVGKWERIYYEEGPQALFEERRGKSKNMISKGNSKNISVETEKDLIQEVQHLRMEVAYLKKLNALVQERVQRESQKKRKP